MSDPFIVIYNQLNEGLITQDEFRDKVLSECLYETLIKPIYVKPEYPDKLKDIMHEYNTLVASPAIDIVKGE